MKFVPGVALGVGFVVFVCALGCGDQVSSAPSQSQSASQPASGTVSVSASNGGVQEQSGTAPAQAPPTLDKDAKQELSDLAKEHAARDAVMKDMQKQPGDQQVQAKFITLNDKLANDTMMSQALTPHEKYPAALRLYRQSLKVDPHDAEAQKWVDMMVHIYKDDLHRDVPQ